MRFFLICCVTLWLASCTDRSYSPIYPDALEVGAPFTVFAATSRAQESDGTFGFRRSEQLSLLELTVSIPPNHTPGELKFGYANPKPKTEFTLAQQTEFNSFQAFETRLTDYIQQKKAGPKEVTVFVHGYNTTQNETAFRAAQLAHDVKLPGALVLYSWPSRARAFGYAYDYDSMLFARDGLEKLIREVKRTGAERIILLAHSMGSALTMEMLRLVETNDPGWAKRHLGGIVLISPDLDVDVFRSQMNRIEHIPQPFVIMVSEKDKALNVSARLRGTSDSERLGNISSIDKIADLPIEIIDTTAFSSDAASSHFVTATSPALIALLNSARSMSDTFGPEDFGLNVAGSSVRQIANGATEIALTPGTSLASESR